MVWDWNTTTQQWEQYGNSEAGQREKENIFHIPESVTTTVVSINETYCIIK